MLAPCESHDVTHETVVSDMLAGSIFQAGSQTSLEVMLESNVSKHVKMENVGWMG